MYLYKENEIIKIILIDFKNKPKSAYFSIAKCIEFWFMNIQFFSYNTKFG